MYELKIITGDKVMIKNPKPMHPGTVLNEVYMAEMGLNQSQLAVKLPSQLNHRIQFHTTNFSCGRRHPMPNAVGAQWFFVVGQPILLTSE